jgi:hypothetical protein
MTFSVKFPFERRLRRSEVKPHHSSQLTSIEIMNNYEIGSVTYCTNVPRGYSPSDEDADFVAEQVEAAFRRHLEESIFREELVVLRVEYGVGCILTTITLGAAIPAIYKFIKDYPKFRPGLLLLLKDLNGIFVRVRGTEYSGSTYIMRDDIKEPTELAAIAHAVEVNEIKPAKPRAKRTRAQPKIVGDA